MKIEIYALLVVIPVVCCRITTEYKNLQTDGYVRDLEMLHCQLRANGNDTCAIRINTTTTNGVIEERETCEQLPVDWCWARIMEPGFTYFGKQTVTHTPPIFLYHYGGAYLSWGTWEIIPVPIEAGTELAIEFKPPSLFWHKIRIDLYSLSGAMLYMGTFYPSISTEFIGHNGGSTQISSEPAILQSGVISTIVVRFDHDSIMIYVDDVLDIDYNYILDPRDIRILQFVFFDNQGDIRRLSYKAATW